MRIGLDGSAEGTKSSDELLRTPQATFIELCSLKVLREFLESQVRNVFSTGSLYSPRSNLSTAFLYTSADKTAGRPSLEIFQNVS